MSLVALSSAGQLQSEEAEEKDASDVDEVAGEKKSETKTTTTTAAGPAQSQSVVATLELGKVVPKVIKHAMVFGMGTWVSQKLSPAVAGQVRAARVIYTAYLIFYQGLCMYLRYEAHARARVCVRHFRRPGCIRATSLHVSDVVKRTCLCVPAKSSNNNRPSVIVCVCVFV